MFSTNPNQPTGSSAALFAPTAAAAASPKTNTPFCFNGFVTIHG